MWLGLGRLAEGLISPCELPAEPWVGLSWVSEVWLPLLPPANFVPGAGEPWMLSEPGLWPLITARGGCEP